jgi:hypothetical protein
VGRLAVGRPQAAATISAKKSGHLASIRIRTTAVSHGVEVPSVDDDYDDDHVYVHVHVHVHGRVTEGCLQFLQGMVGGGGGIPEHA